MNKQGGGAGHTVLRSFPLQTEMNQNGSKNLKIFWQRSETKMFFTLCFASMLTIKECVTKRSETNEGNENAPKKWKETGCGLRKRREKMRLVGVYC